MDNYPPGTLFRDFEGIDVDELKHICDVLGINPYKDYADLVS